MFSMNLFYIIMSGAIIISAILRIEQTGASILASLPINVRDQANAKIKWVFLILPATSLIPILFFLKDPNLGEIVTLHLIFLPVGSITAISSLILKVRMFGKLKYKYVLDEVNLNFRILKGLLIFLLNFTFYLGIITLLGYYILESERYNWIFLIKFLIPIEVGFIILIRYFYNKLFPKTKIFPFKNYIDQEKSTKMI